MNIILDPILKEIDIDDNTLRIINSLAFQRLGRIKQTGYSIYAFPGLSQTRMLHSLGIFGICQYLINNNKEVKKHLTKYEQEVLKYSALLHDIGHGPNSHFFEQLTKVNHEYFSVLIIKNNLELNQILKTINRKLPGDICKVIQKTHSNPVLSQIISSNVDIDRMDYLIRDSYYSGVNHGVIDFRYILRNMGILNNKIYFKEIAINSIENFLISRYHMYQSIYYNSKTECYEWLVIKIIERILYLYSNGKIKETNPFLDIYLNLLKRGNQINNYSCTEYLKTDDYTFHSFIIWFANSNDLILKTLISDFLHHRRFMWFILKNKNRAAKKDKIKAGLCKKFGVSDFRFLFASSKSGPGNTCLSFFKTKSITNPPILIMKKDTKKSLVTIITFSKVIRALNAEFTGRVKPLERFYYWREYNE